MTTLTALPDRRPPVTERFSNRVADYVAARPGYPAELIRRLREVGGLPAPGALVADVGSGTGVSAAWLLDGGYRVVAVEPNAPMRRASEAALGGRSGFQSVDGTAERTGLATGCVQAIVVAQAFHWFEPTATRQEFVRILGHHGPEAGPVVLLWNDRRTEGSPLHEGYEAMLGRWAIDYREVNHRRIDAAALDDFFAGGRSVDLLLENVQRLDLAGLRARVRSSSYVPAEGHPRFEPMMAEVDDLFRRCQQEGVVELVYDLRVRVGWIPVHGR